MTDTREDLMDTFLIEPDALQAKLGAPGLVVIDCSWNIPEAGRDMAAEFRTGHIPGARFLDLDAISDRSSPYVNMMPTADQFAREVGRLGIGNDTEVVVYDSGYVSARVWWMFRVFGHHRVAILNGGWKRWKQDGRPVETGEAAPAAPAAFSAVPAVGAVAGWADVLAALKDGAAQVVDARTKERYTGELPSGYPGVAGGHMPGAVNIPWARMIPQSGDFTFVSPEAARAVFAEAGVDLGKPMISTCGSGVTAAILVFQLARLGHAGVPLYDGSWHEWGQRPDLPKQSVKA
jgi:thiosulfate/3-mercaptopyruvate sulfurtransferase